MEVSNDQEPRIPSLLLFDVTHPCAVSQPWFRVVVRQLDEVHPIGATGNQDAAAFVVVVRTETLQCAPYRTYDTQSAPCFCTCMFSCRCICQT